MGGFRVLADDHKRKKRLWDRLGREDVSLSEVEEATNRYYKLERVCKVIAQFSKEPIPEGQLRSEIMAESRKQNANIGLVRRLVSLGYSIIDVCKLWPFLGLAFDKHHRQKRDAFFVLKKMKKEGTAAGSAVEIVRQLVEQGFSIGIACEEAGISRSAFYRQNDEELVVNQALLEERIDDAFEGGRYPANRGEEKRLSLSYDIYRIHGRFSVEDICDYLGIGKSEYYFHLNQWLKRYAGMTHLPSSHGHRGRPSRFSDQELLEHILMIVGEANDNGKVIGYKSVAEKIRRKDKVSPRRILYMMRKNNLLVDDQRKRLSRKK